MRKEVIGVLLILLLVCARATQIVSDFRMIVLQDGQQHSVRELEIECTDTNPFSFEVVRADSSNEVDNVMIQCGAPLQRYQAEFVELVPLSTRVISFPVFVGETRDRTNAASQYVDRIAQDQMKRTSQTVATPVQATSRTLFQLPDDTIRLPTADDLNDIGAGDDFASEQSIRNRDIAEQAITGLALTLATGSVFALVGAGLNIVLDWFGQGADEKLEKNILTLAADVTKIGTDLVRFENQQIQTDEDIQTLFYYQEGQIDQLQKITENQDREIEQIEENVEAIAKSQQAMVDSLNQRFSSVSTDISLLLQGEQNTSLALNRFRDLEDQRFQMTLNTFHKLAYVNDALSNEIASVQQQKKLRRTLNSFFQLTLTNSSQGNALGIYRPFMADTGLPPNPVADTASNAIVVGAVLFQGTSSELGQQYAVEHEVALVCSQSFLAEIASTTISFEFFVRSIGPDGCESPTWTCNCAFRVNTTRIQYHAADGTKLFPFEFAFPGVPMSFNPDTYTVFASHITSSNILNGNGFAFYSDLTDLQAFLASSAVCAATWITQRLRVVSKFLRGTVDLVMNAALFGGRMCVTDYYTLTQPEYRGNGTVGKAFFAGMNREVNALFPDAAAQAEIDRYGAMGQARVRSYVGSLYPQVIRAHETHVTEYAMLLTTPTEVARTLPVYLLNRDGDTEFSVTVQVNSQSPVTVANAQTRTTMPFNDSQVGNITLVTQNTLSSVKRLPDTFKWLGHETKYKDPRFWDSITQRPTKICDFDLGDLPVSGASKNREGTYNYIRIERARFKRSNPALEFAEGMAFNISEYELHDSPGPFDPTAASVTPTNNLRELIAGSQICGDQFSPTTMERITTPLPNKFGCQTRLDFLVEPFVLDPDTLQEMTFTSRGPFSYRVIVRVPEGAIQQNQYFNCPETTSVTVSAGAAFIQVTGTRPATLRYSICAAGRTRCSTNGDLISVPTTLTFNTPGETFYFQAWNALATQPTQTNRCFAQNGGEGLALTVTRNYTTVSTLPSNYEAEVGAVVDAKTLRSNMLNVALALSQEAMNLAAQKSSSQDIANQIAANQAAINSIVGNISSIDDDPALDALEQQAMDIITRNNASIAAEQTANEVSEQKIDTLRDQFNEVFNNLTLDILAERNLTKEQIAFLALLFNQIKSAENANDGGFPDLGGGNCGWVFPKLKCLLQWIEKIIVIVIVIALIYVVCFQCGAFSAIVGLLKPKRGRSQDEDKEDEERDREEGRGGGYKPLEGERDKKK